MGLCYVYTERTPWPTGELAHPCMGTWATSAPGSVVDTWASLFIRASTPCTPLVALPTRMIVVVFPSSTNSCSHSFYKYRLWAHPVSGTALGVGETDE